MIFAACQRPEATHVSTAGGTFSGAAIYILAPTVAMPRPPLHECRAIPVLTPSGKAPGIHPFTDPGHDAVVAQSSYARITFSRGAAIELTAPRYALPFRTLSRRRAIKQATTTDTLPAATHDTQGA